MMLFYVVELLSMSKVLEEQGHSNPRSSGRRFLGRHPVTVSKTRPGSNTGYVLSYGCCSDNALMNIIH